MAASTLSVSVSSEAMLSSGSDCIDFSSWSIRIQTLAMRRSAMVGALAFW